MAAPAQEKQQKSGRRRIIVIIVAIVIVILLVLAFLPSSPTSSSGGVSLSSIVIRWNGSTYTLLDTPYSSTASPGGFGSAGFNFDAEFIDSGACGSPQPCFDPGNSSFTISSETPGFQVNWVTACYESMGYSALVGPIYGPYSAQPKTIPPGCLSAASGVDMADAKPGSLVYLTVDLQFTSSSGYSGVLTLNGTPVTSSISTTSAGDTTALSLVCTPGVVALGGVTPCTVTVNDTATPPKAIAAPSGYVNFTAPSGSFGPGPTPSCELSSQRSSNSSATCTVTYLASAPGPVLLFASYSGDAGHAYSTGGFSVQTFEYTLAISPADQSVTQGENATYMITATFQQGSGTAGLPNITLSSELCLSGYLKCSFSPAQLNASTGELTATLTILSVPGAVQVPYSDTFSVVGTTGSGDYVFMVTSNTAAFTVTS